MYPRFGNAQAGRAERPCQSARSRTTHKRQRRIRPRGSSESLILGCVLAQPDTAGVPIWRHKSRLLNWTNVQLACRVLLALHQVRISSLGKSRKFCDLSDLTGVLSLARSKFAAVTPALE